MQYSLRSHSLSMDYLRDCLGSVSEQRNGEQASRFHFEDSVYLSQNLILRAKPEFLVDNTSFHFADPRSNEMMAVTLPQSHGHFENCSDSDLVDVNPLTETTADVVIHEKNQMFGADHQGTPFSVDSMVKLKDKTGDQKTLHRVAQNREAVRKSHLRKRLESSQVKLAGLEQELQCVQQQGTFTSIGCAYQNNLIGGNAFDVKYACWLEDHQCLINELRAAINSHLDDTELCLIVDAVISHYDELFRIKRSGAKSDIFHMLSGMWKSPAERCFMWLGDFRSSELLKLIATELEPLTEQQLTAICNLQQSSQQAEDALFQGMEALQQSLSETVGSGSLNNSSFGGITGYMGQMAFAMDKLGTLEKFLRQADLLRQQTLQQMHRILTTQQSARAFLAISDFFSRLRALSSLWLARPKE